MQFQLGLDEKEWGEIENLLRSRSTSSGIRCNSNSANPYFRAHLMRSLHKLVGDCNRRQEEKRQIITHQRGFIVPAHLEADLIQIANSSGLTMSRLAMRTIVNPLLLDLFYDGSKDA